MSKVFQIKNTLKHYKDNFCDVSAVIDVLKYRNLNIVMDDLPGLMGLYHFGISINPFAISALNMSNDPIKHLLYRHRFEYLYYSGLNFDLSLAIIKQYLEQDLPVIVSVDSEFFSTLFGSGNDFFESAIIKNYIRNKYTRPHRIVVFKIDDDSNLISFYDNNSSQPQILSKTDFKIAWEQNKTNLNCLHSCRNEMFIIYRSLISDNNKKMFSDSILDIANEIFYDPGWSTIGQFRGYNAKIKLGELFENSFTGILESELKPAMISLYLTSEIILGGGMGMLKFSRFLQRCSKIFRNNHVAELSDVYYQLGRQWREILACIYNEYCVKDIFIAEVINKNLLFTKIGKLLKSEFKANEIFNNNYKAMLAMRSEYV